MPFRRPGETGQIRISSQEIPERDARYQNQRRDSSADPRHLEDEPFAGHEEDPGDATWTEFESRSPERGQLRSGDPYGTAEIGAESQRWRRSESEYRKRTAGRPEDTWTYERAPRPPRDPMQDRRSLESDPSIGRPPTSSFDRLLLRAVDARASDVHIVAGECPRLRIAGELVKVEHRPLSAGDIRALVLRIAPREARANLESEHEVDFSYEHPDGFRFRISVFRERRGGALAIRRLFEEAYSLEQLNLPQDLVRVIYADSGLVLFAGHAGAGKTTTMASILQAFCTERSGHLITLEDPIEYKLDPRNAYLTQRQLGRHFQTINDGMIEALRANPDAIAIGEIRDPIAMRLALQAAEAGCLVFGTIHAYDVSRTITRIIDSFPGEEQQEIRMALAYTLRMVVAQTLLRRADDKGRIPAVEVCHASHALSTLVREGKSHEIRSLLESNRSRGMRTLDSSLVELVRSGKVRAEDALFRAVRKENVERLLAS
jgi:twitching motility protein PilT